MAMKTHIAILCAALAGGACKKSGGGGGWFTTSTGRIVHVDDSGAAHAAVDLGPSESLDAIACRYEGEAWVVGSHGAVQYTPDGGSTWSAQQVPTQANLRALATQDAGPVFVAGDGVLLRSTDTGASWQVFGDGQTAFRSLAAAEAGATVLAISDDGGLWSFDGATATLARRTTLQGARAVAVSPDGTKALVVGRGAWRSIDAGMTWVALASDPAIAFDDVRMLDDGSAFAVGSAGTIASVDDAGAMRVQHVGSADLHTLHVAEPDAADATGYAGGDGGTVWITHDSGATWSRGPVLDGDVLGVDEIGVGHR
jgi:photosystem II stability/assembly factor-like uncharacterized protein